MTSRSAEATIKGYYYQFDTTILKLLELEKMTDEIAIEGIEDIDIHTATESTAVQCKYLSKSSFTNSSVREPIMLMLDHFIANPKLRLNYVLYAHFEKEKGGARRNITLQNLKDILTYVEKKVPKSYHGDKGISDLTLTTFLKHFKMIFGTKFEDQQATVITKLKSHFRCSDFEADAFYYNNALRKVIDTSILKSAKKRQFSKGHFIVALDTAKHIYNEWYVRLRSKNAFLKQVAGSVKATKSDRPSKSRHVIIGQEILEADNSELSIIGFIENIIHNNYRMGYALRDVKPITLILDINHKQINVIKKQLIENDISFNDGYEHIGFSADVFDKPPLVNVSGSGSKISRSSYLIRLISKDTLLSLFDKIAKPKVVLNFSKKETPYEKSSDYSLFDIKHCETLKDISTII